MTVADSRTRQLVRRPLAWFLGVAAVWLSYSLPSLHTYPAPYGDEVWIASISVQWLEHGNFNVPPFGDSIIYNDYKVFHLYNVALAGVFRLFGIGLTQARAWSLIGAVVSAGLLWQVGQRLYGPAVGVLGSAIYLFSIRVLWLGHVGRTDIWVNAGELAALLLFLSVRVHRRPPRALLLGLLAAGIVDIYLTAAYASLAICILMLVEFRRRAEWKTLAGFALGGLLGTLAWFAIRLLPDVGERSAQFQMLWSASFGNTLSIWQRLAHVPYVLYISFVGYSRIGLLEFPYMAAGLWGLWKRRHSNDWIVPVYFSVVMLFYLSAFVGHHHFIYLVPILSLACAAALRDLAAWIEKQTSGLGGSPDRLAAGLALPLLCAYIAVGLYLGWQNRQIDYAGYTQALRRHLPPASNVLGESTWWFAFRDGTYTADEYLVLNRRRLFPDGQVSQASFETMFAERKINAVLLDESFGFSLSDRYIEPIHEALDDFLRRRCVLTGVVEGDGYGIEQSGPAVKRTQVFVCPSAP
jgi:hypothetical protein